MPTNDKKEKSYFFMNINGPSNIGGENEPSIKLNESSSSSPRCCSWFSVILTTFCRCFLCFMCLTTNLTKKSHFFPWATGSICYTFFFSFLVLYPNMELHTWLFHSNFSVVFFFSCQLYLTFCWTFIRCFIEAFRASGR